MIGEFSLMRVQALSVADKSSVTSATDSEPNGPIHRINIDNPLATLTSEQLTRKLDEFLVIASDLEGSLTLLRQGARLVQDKDDALEDDALSLSPEQKDYLKDLNAHCELEHPRLREESSDLSKQSKFLKSE